jgi:hypothetical protein
MLKRSKKFILAGLAITIVILTFAIESVLEGAGEGAINSVLNTTSQSIPSIDPLFSSIKGLEAVLTVFSIVSLIFVIIGILRKHRIL